MNKNLSDIDWRFSAMLNIQLTIWNSQRLFFFTLKFKIFLSFPYSAVLRYLYSKLFFVHTYLIKYTHVWFGRKTKSMIIKIGEKFVFAKRKMRKNAADIFGYWFFLLPNRKTKRKIKFQICIEIWANDISFIDSYAFKTSFDPFK